ncbi:unnamed protein product [Prunus armeniaca]
MVGTVVEDLMAKQADRIETSFVAAMDRFSSELRTLFQERMPPSSTTPPRDGQRSQERKRFELCGESNSHVIFARARASSYGQHSQPSTNSWGQSQPTWANPGPTCPAETARSPLHALAVSLGRSSATRSVTRQTSLVHTVAVQSYATCTHPGQTYDAYLMPHGSAATAELCVQMAQQTEPQNDTQQVQRPLPTQLEPLPQDHRTKEIQRATKDGLAQRQPGAPSYTKPYLPGEPRTWCDLLPKASWERRASKHSAVDTSPCVLTHGHDIDKLTKLGCRIPRVAKRHRRKIKNHAQTTAQKPGDSKRSGLDTYKSVQVQGKMAPKAYGKKVKKKKKVDVGEGVRQNGVV